MTDTLTDLVPLLERMQNEQIPNIDRLNGRRIFGLPASCPHCAGLLELVNTTAQELLAIGIVACEACTRQFEITVRMTPHVYGRR